MKQQAMSEADYARKVDELERLLNDPEVPMEPSRVWSLLAEIKHASFDGAAGISVSKE
jgi:antitoxin component HigA of HigAB toxin-antitoxin module